jgi:hypothetical protein|tara:strand:+ start:154 stop:369 length:216 start_codon:yes stop_codon:yes gene_type:complete
MANINVKVNSVTTGKVKQIAIGQVAAENIDLNDLRNVDTTTVTASDGDCIVFDASTQKFEASSGIDGGYYG